MPNRFYCSVLFMLLFSSALLAQPHLPGQFEVLPGPRFDPNTIATRGALASKRILFAAKNIGAAPANRRQAD